jgi:uncharacterized protein (TIGR02118 family)
MTVKLVVLYTQPEDPEAFEKEYADVHMPLVEQLPGLERAEVGRMVTALDGGEKTYYWLAELHFADDKAMQAAFGSEAGKATAAHYGKIAPPGSRMFVQHVAD